MKKIVTLFAALFSFAAVLAATETVNGVTYTYSISNGEATIGSGYDSSAAIPQSTSGALVIPSTLGGCPVTTIGRDAFLASYLLTSVTIPSSVTTIGERAFVNCSSLTSVTIPSSVTTIGEWAFYSCHSLTSVTIPEGVTTIGLYAFCNCISLTSVTIPEGVTKIGGYAFYNCSSLTSVTIPSSVTEIGSEAFDMTPFLDNQPNGFVIFGKVLYKYKGECSSKVTIPLNVTMIGAYAFSGCSSLTSVTIPEGVTTIGAGAFYDCDSLTSVTIPSSVTTIGGSAFSGCSSLSSVTIPSSVTTIGGSAFSGCSSLSSVTIPSSVTTIGSEAFNGTPFFNSKPDGLVVVGCVLYAVKGKCPSEVVIPVGVMTIGDRVFDRCSSLTSVTIPSSVTTIEEYAFSSCRSLTSVTIPEGVKLISYGAFYKCSSLVSVTISSSVTTIKEFAFEGCSSLTSVTIPESVTEIGWEAFGGCPLSEVWVEKGDSARVKELLRGSGASVDALTFVEMSAKLPDGGPYTETVDGVEYTFLISDGKAMIGGALNDWGFPVRAIPESTSGALVIPSKLGGCPVMTIGEAAFGMCSSLTSVTIPNGVTTIGHGAFNSCSSLTSVTIPEGVTTIGELAFYDCSSLTSVMIPSSVTTIGEDAFTGNRLNSFVVSSENSSYRAIDGILYTKDGKVLLSCPCTRSSVTIPAGVITIGDNAFSACSLLTAVTISDSVTAIGKWAFNGCSSLTSLTIPSSVTTIGEDAFVRTDSLNSIIVSPENPSYRAIDGILYTKDSKVLVACPGARTSVTISNGVTAIGNSAFSGCSSLTSVTMPNSVTEIGKKAFYFCNSLESLTIPNGVSTIGELAFMVCSSLTTVTIPNSVTTIGDNAFGGCPLSEVRVEAGDEDRVKGLLADSGGFDVSSLIFREIPKQESDPGEGNLRIAFVVSDGEASLAEANYPTNGVYGRLPEARREGFTFAGWYTAFDGGKRVGAFSMINPEVTTLYARWVEQDVSLYAQWAANAYTVNFNANGGSGAMAAQPFLYDQTQPLSANGFTKTGYTFKGWSTSPEGEVVFTDAAAVSNLTAEAGFAVALFAQWNKTVELDTDDISDWVAYDLADQYAAKHGTNARGYRDLFRSTFGNDYSAAFHKETGKVAADGTRLQVWHDYVAGTDPLDPESKFTASMTMVDGKPVVSWTPELDAERAAMRKYTTYGKVKLTDNEWTVVEEGHASDYNFFKVTVEMK